MEDQPTIQEDPSTNPQGEGVAPSVNPVDSPDVSQAQTKPQDDQPTYMDDLYEAGQNLAPSEIPHVEDLPRLFGAIAYKEQNGDFPKPLHERFPDHYPSPENE